MSHIAAAVFDDKDHAERAVAELRRAGVPDSRISVIASHGGHTTTSDGAGTVTDDHDNKGTGLLKGLGIGGGVGALAGLAALAIPGVGPFIAAGALAETLGAVGSAAVTSAAVGATAGGLTGALVDYGVDREHAAHYERRVNEGAVFVAVDTSNQPDRDQATVTSMLRAAGGEIAGASHSATV